MPDGRAKSLVNTCGIGFAATDENLVRLREAGATSVVTITVRRRGEQQAWGTVKDSGEAKPVEEFLRIYGKGQFGNEAREKLRNLKRGAPEAGNRRLEAARPKDLPEQDRAGAGRAGVEIESNIGRGQKTVGFVADQGA